MAITKTKASTEAHIALVRGDPDFIEEFNSLDRSGSSEVDNLYNRYGLESDDLGTSFIKFQKLLNPYKIFSSGHLNHDAKHHKFVVTFSEDIKKEQFDELWTLIQKNKEKINIPKTKEKPPQEDVLLYAIFKARMAGITFRDIFKDYSNDTLPYYSGKSINQFHSEDELEKYYRRFYKSKL